MKNKRGQFYIIAAIMIVLAISGLTSVATYAIAQSKPATIYDLKSDLNEESLRIVEHGLFNDKDVDNLMDDFTQNFSYYFYQKTEDSEVIFIYGNTTELQEVRWEPEETGNITFGGETMPDNQTGRGAFRRTITRFIKKTRRPLISGNRVKVDLGNQSHEFELKDHQMFYFILTQERDGERYVETNQ
jgi:hypothetical protein